MSQLPATVAAEARLIFPKVQNLQGLESFFLTFSLSLFDSITSDRTLIGRIKLYGEGKSKTMIRADATGRRENVQVEIRNFEPEKEVKIWMNIIAYKRSEDELRSKLLRTLTQLTSEHEVKLRELRVAHGHDHQINPSH